jgi:predicted DNA-binding protein
MERISRQFTISMPPDMADQVAKIARAESRTVSELFREAFRAYRASRVRAVLDAAQLAGSRTRHMGHGPEDVPRLIRETRREGERRRRVK